MTKSMLKANRPPPPATPSPTNAKPKASDISDAKKEKKLSRRKLIIDELIETEHYLCEQFEGDLQVYLEPLKKLGRDPKEILSKEETSSLFGEIPSILSIQQQLLHDNLEKLIEDDTNSKGKLERRKRGLTVASKEVAGTFKMFAPAFQLYSKFVVQFDSSIAFLTMAREKRKSLSRFLEKCRKNERCNGLTLESYLIMPVQRVPRYKMLLSELLKHTNPTKNDYADLKAAVQAVSDVAIKINNSIHSHDAAKKMAQIQSEFGTSCKILKSSRLFLEKIDGSVTLNEEPNSGEMEDASFYLFNDMLLIGKPGSSSLNASNEMIPVVDQIDLVDVPASFTPGSGSIDIGRVTLSWRDTSMANQISAWQNKLADAANRCRNAQQDLSKRASLPNTVQTKINEATSQSSLKFPKGPAFNRKTRAEPPAPSMSLYQESSTQRLRQEKSESKKLGLPKPPPNLPSLLPPGIHVTHITEDGLTKTEIDKQSKTSRTKKKQKNPSKALPPPPPKNMIPSSRRPPARKQPPKKKISTPPKSENLLASIPRQ